MPLRALGGRFQTCWRACWIRAVALWTSSNSVRAASAAKAVSSATWRCNCASSSWRRRSASACSRCCSIVILSCRARSRCTSWARWRSSSSCSRRATSSISRCSSNRRWRSSCWRNCSSSRVTRCCSIRSSRWRSRISWLRTWGFSSIKSAFTMVGCTNSNLSILLLDCTQTSTTKSIMWKMTAATIEIG